MAQNKDQWSWVLVCIVVCAGQAEAKTSILTLNEDQRLEVNISNQSMNRIRVVDDRIVNIVGAEGAFLSQNEEQTGQVFIKVTPEQGDKPLPLTLVTENGLTQDLSLIPSEIEASTLILKERKKPISPPLPLSMGLGSARGQSRVDRLLQVMKQAINGELSLQKESSIPARTLEHFSVHYQSTYLSDDLKVQHWTIQNTSKSLQELLEKNFYAPRDLALSLQQRFLAPNEKTDLYIVKGFDDVEHG